MKKLTITLLSLLCLFSLTGCGGREKPKFNDDGTITFKLGGSGPLSGGAKTYGEAVRTGASIAVDEVNNSDSKIKFEFNMQDDEHDPEKAASAYATLYDWGMHVSLFTVTSGPGAAVAEKYNNDKIVALTPSGSATDLVYTDSKNYPGNFQMCFTDPNQGIASADYVAEYFKDAKVGIIYKQDDVYSSGIHEKFIAEAKAKNVDVVYDDGAFTGDSPDYSTLLTSAKTAGADFIFIPIYYEPAAAILDQANKMDYKPTFFGVDGLDGLLTLEGFKTELAEGVYLLTPFSATSTDSKTVSFVEKYKTMTGDVPNQFAADAYDCVYAMCQALENIGIDENYNFDNLYDDLISQFTSMTFDGLTGSSMTWSENGEIKKAPEAFIIKDGVYTK